MNTRDLERLVLLVLLIKLGMAIFYVFTSHKSTETERRGQKVISYSLFKGENDFEKYKLGITLNLAAIRRFYNNDPDGWVNNHWRMRIYSDVDITEDITEILESYPELDWIDVRKMPVVYSRMNKLAWRFLPLGDPHVDVFLSRDLDSIISAREKSAVDEWLNSDKVFHSMRDTPEHNFFINAGLWGGKNYLIEFEDAQQLKNNFILAGETTVQKMLEHIIWFPFYKRIMTHDSFLCEIYQHTRPWPTKRENSLDYVGAPDLRIYPNPVKRKTICPIICRPSYGKDWKYC